MKIVRQGEQGVKQKGIKVWSKKDGPSIVVNKKKMSLVTLIRDYVDVANSTEKLDGYTLSSLAYHTIIFLFTVAKQAIVYCFTFHWLRDLTYFCFTPPLILSSFANIGEIGKFIGDPSLHEVQSPLSHLLAFSDWNSSTGVGIVFVGFFNGCFSCLHLSAAHLITIRRMLVQGVPAGLYSALGTAIGQFLFVASIFFGFRGLLFPWLALEPLQFFLGTGIILSVASTMAQDRRTPTIQWSAKPSLFIYLCTNAALAWCEQAAIFQWMGNFSLGAEPTFLETTPSLGVVIDLAKQVNIETGPVLQSVNSTKGTSSFSSEAASNLIPNFWGTFVACVQTPLYLLTFLGGSVLGVFLIAFLLQRFLELVLRYKKIAVYYGLVKQANLPLATLLFAFGFGSMPYYGFDYLVTKGFGFIPQEHFFKQTLFSPINLVSKTGVQASGTDSPQNRLEDQLALFFTLEGERSKSFAVDTTPFDDGQYLKTNQKRPQTFEDLNYRGEHLWTNRLSRISNIREQANQTQSSFLGPVFSWMRSFLWGDEPGSILTNNATNAPASLMQVPGNPMIDSDSNSTNLRLANPLSGEKQHSVGSPVEYTEGTEGIEDTRQMSAGYASSQPLLKKAGGTDTIHKKEFSFEMEENDNYLTEFDKQFDKGFSNFYDADPPSLIEVEDQWQEKRIKEKCYKNPIYKFLLNTEIDAFLARQPNSHWLSPEEEILLLKRRQVLGNYYDTLAFTNQVSTSEALEQLVPKSYSNTIYNHQFKGTLKIARRLFSVKKASVNTSGLTQNQNNNDVINSQSELDFANRRLVESTIVSDQPLLPAEQLESSVRAKTQTRVVKFDQPLFLNKTSTPNTQQTLFHEELLPFQIGTTLETFAEFSPANLQMDKDKISVGIEDTLKTVNQKDAVKSEKTGSLDASKMQLGDSLESTGYSGIGAAPSELMAKNATRYTYGVNKLGADKKRNGEKHLLEQAESSPLYAGWDEELRKFIVTNKYQNRTLAGYTFSKHPEHFPDNSQAVTIFTTWPIPNPLGVSWEANGENASHQPLQSDQMGSYANDIFDQEAISQEKSQPSLKTNIKSRNQLSFLFQSKPATNDMVNALLQWQKLMKENKPQETANKQVAKEKISYWPANIRRANWSNEIVENDMEFDEPTENVFKKKILLWEFIPPYHGGFVWSTTNYATHSQ